MTTFKSMSVSQALKTIEEMVDFTRHSTDNTLQASTRAASTSYHHAVITAEERLDAATSSSAEFAALQHGTMKAAMQASTIMFDGMQELTRQMLGALHDAAYDAVAHGHSSRGAKSINELARMNKKFSQERLEKAVTNGARLAEEAVKLTEQASKPLTLHISDRVLPQINEQLAAALQRMIQQPGNT